MDKRYAYFFYKGPMGHAGAEMRTFASMQNKFVQKYLDADETLSKSDAEYIVKQWNLMSENSGAGSCYSLAPWTKAEVQIDLTKKPKPIESWGKAAKKKPSEMKKGEIKSLPASQTPPFCDQWAAMGSGKTPYIVTHNKQKAEWQCSCPSWTQNVPRDDCKHILKVKLETGMVEKILTVVKKKAITVEVVDTGTALVVPKGRKFR